MRLVLLLLTIGALAWAGDATREDRVLTLNAGMSHARVAGWSPGVDLEGTFLIYNAAVESALIHDQGHEVLTARAYAGLGVGPLLQVQGGLGYGGPSVRLRSNVNLLALRTTDSLLDRLVQYREEDYRRWAPMVTLFVDRSRHDLRFGFLVGMLL